VLYVAGKIDGSNYLKLVEKASDLFASGTDYLLMDLEAVDFLSSSGLFALQNIALLAHKIEPLDPEDGWGAMKTMADDDRDFKDNFKIVNVQPKVLRTLDIAGFSPKFDLYSDMRDALAAFKPTG
jgi:anti-anti-sigma regulatory factor